MSSCRRTHPKCLENWRASASSWWFLQLLDGRQESYKNYSVFMRSPSTVPALFVQVMVWSATKPETPGAAIKEHAIQPTPWCSKGNHRLARTATTFVELPKLARNLSSNLEGWKAGWRKKTGGGIKTTDWYTQNTIKIFLSCDAPQPLQPMGKWSAPLVLGPKCFPKRSKKDIIGFEDPTDGLPYQNRRSKPKRAFTEVG